MVKVEFFFEKELKFEQVADTYRKAYHRELDANYWNWRYLMNPIREKVLISYIIENNDLAAYYSATPCVLVHHQAEYKFVLVNMAMTHPSYQRKGYLKMVAGELFKALGDMGYVGALGFANANSHYGHRKHLGWIDLSVLNNFKTEKQNFKLLLSEDSCKYDFVSGNIDNETVLQTEKMIYSNHPLYIKRDQQFLKWRLQMNPMHTYFFLKIFCGNRLDGIIFYKLFQGNIDVLEFFYNPLLESKRNIILNSGVNKLLNKASESVQLWSNLHTDEHIMLEKSGFRESHFITYMGVIPFKDFPEIVEYKNWHFRYIDSDVF
jgi:hypothetical protein